RSRSCSMRPTSGSTARLPGRYGAGEQPQLPATIVVMPCSRSGASTSAWSGSGITQSLCECMSMNPGATTLPAQSRRRAAGASARSPTAAMRSPAIPTDAGKPSRPLPSSTVPPSSTRSKVMRRPFARVDAGAQRTGLDRTPQPGCAESCLVPTPAGRTRMAGLAERCLGAARLNAATYEDVEADPSATGQAVLVVALAAIAAGIGVADQAGIEGIVGGTIGSLIA